MKAPNSLEVVSQVHSLYQAAFSDFVVVVGVVVGVTGILLPVFITVAQFLQQKREAKIANDKIEILVKSAVEAVESRLLQENAKALEAFASRSEEQLKQSKDEMERKLQRLEAAAFHVQASALIRTKEFLEAATSAANGVSGYIASKDFQNLRRVFEGILSPCLKEMNSGHFKKMPSLKESIEGGIKSVRGADEHGAFTDLLDRIERELSVATLRNEDDGKAKA